MSAARLYDDSLAVVATRVLPSQRARLAELARRMGVTVSELVREFPAPPAWAGRLRVDREIRPWLHDLVEPANDWAPIVLSHTPRVRERREAA
jgi:hypothetical protein